MEKRPSRRVRTQPAPGTDPEPLRSGERDADAVGTGSNGAGSDSASNGAASNDDRLRQDVPPHW